MTNSYWYVARDNELMLDLDSLPLLQIAMKRLKKRGDFPGGASVADNMKELYIAESGTHEHYHVTILMKENLPAINRMTVQLYLMDDVFRTVKNLIRVIADTPAPCLLISPHNWMCSGVALNLAKFWRNPDAICQCPIQRHKSSDKIQLCPAHIKLRGSK